MQINREKNSNDSNKNEGSEAINLDLRSQYITHVNTLKR